MILNLTVYVRNVISFLYKQQTFKKFLAKNSVLACIWLLIDNLGNQQLSRYCDVINGIFFFMNGKKRPIIPIPWYQISIPQEFFFFFKFIGVTTPPTPFS